MIVAVGILEKDGATKGKEKKGRVKYFI